MSQNDLPDIFKQSSDSFLYPGRMRKNQHGDTTEPANTRLPLRLDADYGAVAGQSSYLEVGVAPRSQIQ